MIPDFVNIDASWRVLPPGLHESPLEEIKERYAYNETRKHLYDGLVKACEALRKAGCKDVYLDGSYVTEKPKPGDFDACWDPTGVDPSLLDPVFLDFSEQRKKQKLKFGGELFPSGARADGLHTFIEFFKIDKETGNEKGIIHIQLYPD